MSLLCAQSYPPTISQPGKGQRAAFLSNVLWPPLTTIKIYFFPLPDARTLSQMRWQTPILPPRDPTKNYNPADFLDPLYETIQGKVDPITLVRTVVQERLQPIVGVTFAYTENIDESDIRIVFGPQYGCSSIVGNTRAIRGAQKLEETMTYGWFDVATVLHEFCHALGMIHEHQNPLENPIQWNDEAILCYFRQTQGWDIEKVRQNIINAYRLDQTNGSKYDEDSIMIYSFNKTLPCTLCEPFNDSNRSTCPQRMLPATLNGAEVRPIYKLSPTDIRWLQIMYPKSGKRNMDEIRTMLTDVTDVPNAPGEGGEGGTKPLWLNQDNLANIGQSFRDFLQKHGKKMVWIIGLIVIYLVVKSVSASPSNVE